MASGIRLLVATSALAACTPQVQGYSIFVSPTGSDSNPGTSSASPLATCAAAVQKIKTVLSDILLVPPAGGIEVLFAGGTYPLTADTACGTVTARGTEAAPIIFRPANVQDAVIFDGTAPLPKARLVPVTNATILQLVNPSAQHSIRVMPVSAASGWTGEGQQLQWGQFPLTPSVWPDEGLGYVQKIYDSGDIYCPGRTKGPPPVCQICTGNERSSAEKPCGANFSLAAAPTGSWGRELEAGPGFGGGQVTLDGYLGADWFHESHTIARVQKHGTTTSVQLGESSHYGICESLEGHGPGCAGGDEGGAPGRFRVRGLLSNVDMPGEYFFDRAAQMLYLIPPRTDDGNLGFWSGPGLVAVTNSSFVTVRGFTVAGSTGTAGAIAIAGGSNNTVGGCTVHSCNSGIMLAGGHENKVVGNDVYDVVYFHVSTSSNAGEDLVDSQAALVPTNNLVSNNQFTQVWLSTTTWSIHSGGIGDRFSNNILHDAPGQLILPGGPLTMWDRNEVFNTGYAEGDGGMIYLHASLVKGYGMHLRENFLHHSLDVPGLIGRHAVQFDDHFGAVSNCSGNVLYKAAGIGLASSGSGNNITNNLIMNSGMAIAVSDLEDMTVNLPAYDNGTLKRGDKMDYVWNAEDDLGLNGSYHALFKTALAARFPSFARQMAINSTQVGWASAGNSMLTGNVFINNSQCNICFEDAEERNGSYRTPLGGVGAVFLVHLASLLS